MKTTVCEQHAWRDVHLISNMQRCRHCLAWRYTNTETGKTGIGHDIVEAVDRSHKSRPSGAAERETP